MSEGPIQRHLDRLLVLCQIHMTTVDIKVMWLFMVPAITIEHDMVHLF